MKVYIAIERKSQFDERNPEVRKERILFGAISQEILQQLCVQAYATDLLEWSADGMKAVVNRELGNRNWSSHTINFQVVEVYEGD